MEPLETGLLMETVDLSRYRKVVFFTGAGMSAESGVPTYRGKGGVWNAYDFQEYACQKAFEGDPEKVLRFHEIRRRAVLDCHPHAGHRVIAGMPEASVITQNIDGMHQRAGSQDVIELHGSLWRLRCERCGVPLARPRFGSVLYRNQSRTLRSDGLRPGRPGGGRKSASPTLPRRVKGGISVQLHEAQLAVVRRCSSSSGAGSVLKNPFRTA